MRRDLALDPTPPDMINNYMELVVQFGFITLFSVVFPLAAPLSLLCNYLQIHTQKQNMVYSRRYKAEVATGIGPWLEILQVIAKVAVIINMGSLFFTSSISKAMFSGVDYQHLVEYVKGVLARSDGQTLDDATITQLKNAGEQPTAEALAEAERLGVPILEPSWDVLDFLLLLILVEHVLILLSMLLEIAIPDAPEETVEGARNTAEVIEQYTHDKGGKLFAEKRWTEEISKAR